MVYRGPASEATEPNSDKTGSRRAVLKKLGVYAAYTAPALVAMLESSKAQYASNCWRQDNDCQGEDQQ